MISLIAALAKNRAIGKDGQLLWHLPEDMRHFRETTRGKPVIMGRKTWESLPSGFRPLPERRNIVVTRDGAYQAAGAVIVSSLPAALAAANSDQAFVVGGAELYTAALPLADRLQLTEIDASFEGDTWFPAIDRSQWHETGRETHHGETGFDYAFVTYQRKQAALFAANELA